jgi:hypothetical protein
LWSSWICHHAGIGDCQHFDESYSVIIRIIRLNVVIAQKTTRSKFTYVKTSNLELYAKFLHHLNNNELFKEKPVAFSYVFTNRSFITAKERFSRRVYAYTLTSHVSNKTIRKALQMYALKEIIQDCKSK